MIERTKRVWSEDEERTLSAMYPTAPMVEIRAALGRSEGAIWGKASKMSLTRSLQGTASSIGHQRTGDTCDQVAEALPAERRDLDV